MDRDEIQGKIFQIIRDHFGGGAGEITLETDFKQELNADSLDSVELIMDFEDAFDIHVPDEKGEAIKTVEDAVNVVFALV
jgi:acyl carrier protein